MNNLPAAPPPPHESGPASARKFQAQPAESRYPLEYRGFNPCRNPGASRCQKACHGMAANIAQIERTNRKDLSNVEVQLTLTEPSIGRQSWKGKFVSRGADGIVPNEPL